MLKSHIIKLILTFCIITLFPVSGFANTTPADIKLIMSNPIFPSTSPIATSKGEELFEKTLEDLMKKGVSAEDIDAVSLAYANRDLAWAKAQEILQGIQNGSIDSKTFLEYTHPAMQPKPNFISFALMKKSMQSFGKNMLLSDKYREGYEPDYMRIVKQPGTNGIKIEFIDWIDKNVKVGQAKNLKSYSYITIIMIAEKPYKEWSLAGMHVKKIVNFK